MRRVSVRQAAAPIPDDLVTIAAAPQDADLAAAALRAALDAGVPWRTSSGGRDRVGRRADNRRSAWRHARVVRMPVPSPPAAAADAVRDVLASVSAPDLKEPVAISAEQLARWTRSPGRRRLMRRCRTKAIAAGSGRRRWRCSRLEWWLRRAAPAAKDAAGCRRGGSRCLTGLARLRRCTLRPRVRVALARRVRSRWRLPWREPRLRRPLFSTSTSIALVASAIAARRDARSRHLAVERRRGGADREANRRAR